MSRFTKGLNKEQCRAVTSTAGPLLVLAGAGTGKTRVITHRIAYMIDQGVSAKSILAMTFTNKAAGEMKERIADLVPKKAAADLTVGTFHSFCVRALRRNASRIGIPRNFGICSADDQLVAMKQALRNLSIPETEVPAKAVLSRVSLLKNKLIEPEAWIGSNDDWEDSVGRAYEKYNQGLKSSAVLDFDDLLLQMVRLLKDKKTLTFFQKRFQYLLIDEYQDTNGPQYEIVRKIGAKHKNVCVVGDDDQSIYGWRGADVSKILNFEKDFPEAKVIRLETNYRSTEEIISGANAVIQNNSSRHDKKLRSHIGSGAEIDVKRAKDEETEAVFVVGRIDQLMKRANVSPGNIAILFRTQVQPRLFELQLREKYIPYNLVGGMSFFDRKEVRDALAYLKLIANPDDELSLLRVINTPARGIGSTTIEKALEIAAQQKLSLADVFRRGAEFPSLKSAAVGSGRRFLGVLDRLRESAPGLSLVDLTKNAIRDVKYIDEIKKCYTDQASRAKRWDAITEIMNMAEIHARHESDPTLSSFLENVALDAQDDEDEKESDKVTLMTLHSAKGLEFEHVYLVGMEEGLLPHSRSIQEGSLEEERRLAYVGITRAKRHLTITFTKSRARYGARYEVHPSRFLYEMRGKKPPAEVLQAAGNPPRLTAPLRGGGRGSGKKSARRKSPPKRKK